MKVTAGLALAIGVVVFAARYLRPHDFVMSPLCSVQRSQLPEQCVTLRGVWDREYCWYIPEIHAVLRQAGVRIPGRSKVLFAVAGRQITRASFERCGNHGIHVDFLRDTARAEDTIFLYAFPKRCIGP